MLQTWLPSLVFLLPLAPPVVHVLADPALLHLAQGGGQGGGVTQQPPDGVGAEPLVHTLVCILTGSLVTVPAGQQGV